MEPVLDLISSYESRIASVEELMSTAYNAAAPSEGRFNILDEERQRLKTGLQKNAGQELLFTKKGF